MQWYLLKTWAGREEELVREIMRTVPPGMYHECFIISQERIWRKQQRNLLHIEPFLPGCAFITCLAAQPLWGRLEMVPAVSRLVVSGNMSILPLTKEDADFLAQIMDADHLVRLSRVEKTADGSVENITGPLGILENVDRYQFKKRYAVVRHRFLGEERTFVLGILLNEDMDQPVIRESTGLRPEERMRAIG